MANIIAYDGQYFVKNKHKVKKLSGVNNIGIFKKYGSGYKLDIWTFPSQWKDIYPFNIDSKIKLQKKIAMSLLFKDKNNNVIYAALIIPKSRKFNNIVSYPLLTSMPSLPIKYAFYSYSMYGYDENIEENIKVLTPMLSTYSKDMYDKIECMHKEEINIDDVKKIKHVTIEVGKI